MLLRAFEVGIIGPHALPIAINEWRKRTFAQFAAIKNAWLVYNALTFALGKRAKSSPQAHARSTIQLGTLAAFDRSPLFTAEQTDRLRGEKPRGDGEQTARALNALCRAWLDRRSRQTRIKNVASVSEYAPRYQRVSRPSIDQIEIDKLFSRLFEQERTLGHLLYY